MGHFFAVNQTNFLDFTLLERNWWGLQANTFLLLNCIKIDTSCLIKWTKWTNRYLNWYKIRINKNNAKVTILSLSGVNHILARTRTILGLSFFLVFQNNQIWHQCFSIYLSAYSSQFLFHRMKLHHTCKEKYITWVNLGFSVRFWKFDGEIKISIKLAYKKNMHANPARYQFIYLKKQLQK